MLNITNDGFIVIEIDDEDGDVEIGEGGTEGLHRGGLGDPTLLIGNGDDDHRGAARRMRTMRASGSVTLCIS